MCDDPFCQGASNTIVICWHMRWWNPFSTIEIAASSYTVRHIITLLGLSTSHEAYSEELQNFLCHNSVRVPLENLQGRHYGGTKLGFPVYLGMFSVVSTLHNIGGSSVNLPYVIPYRFDLLETQCWFDGTTRSILCVLYKKMKRTGSASQPQWATSTQILAWTSQLRMLRMETVDASLITGQLFPILSK